MEHSRPVSWAIVLLAGLLLAACSPEAGGTAATTAAPPSQEAGTAEPEIVYGPGDFDLADVRGGLEELSSYRATLVVAFEGTQDGQPQQWSSAYAMQVIKDPPTRVVTVENSGNLPDVTPLLMAEVNGIAYEQRGDGECVATAADPENPLAARWEPAGLLSGVIGAEEAGTDQVNQVAVTHYTFDERALGKAGVADSTGEMWIASDGGTVVRYLLTTTAGEAYFGEDMEGTITWSYELTDVGLAASPALPEGCPEGLVNAPLMPDAADVLNMPGVLSFTTASSPADATAFYQEQLPALGWALQEGPAITDTSAFFEYVQGEKLLTVVISTGEGGTDVRLLLSDAVEP